MKTMPSPFSKEAIDFFAKFFDIRRIFAVLLLALIALNSSDLAETIQKNQAKHKRVPMVFYGFLFSGLNQILPNVKRIGYFTDKSFDNKDAAAQFAQAQYVLAPIILDLDYKKHEWILFDCSSEEKAQEAIRQTGAVAVKRNPYGIILARLEPAQQPRSRPWKPH